jgi:hypothetical protein
MEMETLDEKDMRQLKGQYLLSPEGKAFYLKTPKEMPISIHQEIARIYLKSSPSSNALDVLVNRGWVVVGSFFQPPAYGKIIPTGKQKAFLRKKGIYKIHKMEGDGYWDVFS